jgi:hypothetical protein
MLLENTEPIYVTPASLVIMSIFLRVSLKTLEEALHLSLCDRRISKNSSPKPTGAESEAVSPFDVHPSPTFPATSSTGMKDAQAILVASSSFKKQLDQSRPSSSEFRFSHIFRSKSNQMELFLLK